MNEERKHISDSQLDHILEQVQEKRERSASPAVPDGSDAQVDAILSELGIGVEKKNKPVDPVILPPVSAGVRRTPGKAQPMQWVPAPVLRQAPKKPIQPSEQAADAADDAANEPAAENPEKSAQTNPEQASPEPSGEKVPDEGKKEPEVPTRELPSIKSYTQEEAKKREEERERIREEARREVREEQNRAEPVGEAVVQAAREAARKREEEKRAAREKAQAERKKAEDTTVTGNNMFGEVDDRFRDFFSSTVIDDPKLNPEARRKREKGGFWANLFPKKEEAPQENEPEPDTEGTYYESAIEDGFTGEFNAISPEQLSRLGIPVPEAQEPQPQPAEDKKKSAAHTHTAAFLARSITKADTFDFETGSRRKTKSLDFDIPLDGDGTGEYEPMRRKPAPGVDAEEEAMGEYNTLSDAPVVESELDAMRQGRLLRTVISSVLTLMLLYLGFSAREGVIPPIAALDPHTNPFTYLATSLVLLCLTAFGSMPMIVSGLRELFRNPGADSFTSLALAGAVIQNAAYLVKAQAFDPEKVTLFAPAAALLLCGNALAKWLKTCAVCENFARASSGEEHAAAFLLEKDALAKQLCDGLGEREPQLLLNRPTALVKGFLRQSFSVRAADRITVCTAILLGASALVCAVIAGVQEKDVLAALTCFAGTLCIAAPFAAALVHALPAYFMEKATAKCGAVVPGTSAVETLGSVNTVLLSARELFPVGSVRLHGIKTFEKERIDVAITYAASILPVHCETLRTVFMGILDNNEKLLLPVENAATEIGYGFSGWIEHRRVLMGSREMMKNHDIEVPSLDYEKKYTKDGERCPIYLAVSGKLFGMFLVSYQPAEQAAEIIDSLAQSGISILVKGEDFNLTSELVANCYGIPESTVKVLGQHEQDALEEELGYRPESEGVMIHSGTCESFLGGMRAAACAASSERMAGFLGAAAVALGAGISVALCISHGLAGISLGALLVYQLIWTGVITASLVMKKP